jgi:predicted glutamine amidotransferase
MHVRRLWTEDDNGNRNTDVPWGQDGTRVHVSEPDGVYIEYLVAADPNLWGANFSEAVKMKMEAVLLRNKEDYAAAAAMDQDAERKFQLARTTSSKARSATEPYKQGRIAQARFRRG